MRSVAVALSCVVLIVASISAASQDPGQKPAATFTAATRLIPVTVVVRDNRGRPITGLTAADFRVTEDGREQRIAVFSEQRRAATAAAAAALPPGTFSNRLGAASESGVTILLFDKLNTSDTHQRQAREHILQFLRTLKPNDRVGFYLLNGAGLHVLHDVTTDVSSLVAAVERAGAQTSVELDGLGAVLRDEGEEIDPDLAEFISSAEMNIRGFFQRRAVMTTAGALEAIGARLAGVRGRKSVVWVSSGFPLRFQDGPIPQNMSPEVRRATRALSSSDIAVYPVDARGLVSAFATPASSTHQRFTTLETVMRTLDGPEAVAEQTGGRVFYNTNAIGRAIERAVDDTAHVYVLGYSSSNERWDSRFRRIKVHVQGRDADVRHRSGYFAHPPEDGSAGVARDRIVDALEAPLDATGVILTAHVAPSGASHVATVAIEPSGLTLQRTGDAWEGSLMFAIAQALPDGRQFSSADATVPIRLSTPERDRLLREGLTLSRTLTLRSDAHQIRIVVRDGPSGRIGSLSIPMNKIPRQGPSGR